jgi:hypothetical protein
LLYFAPRLFSLILDSPVPVHPTFKDSPTLPKGIGLVPLTIIETEILVGPETVFAPEAAIL